MDEKEFVLIVDESEHPIPHAEHWTTGLAAHADGTVGVGMVLRNAEGCPVSGVCFSPEQATLQGSYLFLTGLRLMTYTDEATARLVANQIITDVLTILVEKIDRDAKRAL